MSCKCTNCKCKKTKNAKVLKVNQKVWWHSGYGRHLVKVEDLTNGVWISSNLITKQLVDVREISTLNNIQRIFVFLGLIKF